MDTADDVRPLTSEELCRLDVNVTFFCDLVHIETLINELHVINCMTRAHRDYRLNLTNIQKPKSKRVKYANKDPVKELLSVLQRRSLQLFKRFMEYRRSPATQKKIEDRLEQWSTEANF